MASTPPVFPAWCRTIEDTAEHYGLKAGVLNEGLSDSLVERQRALWGLNELTAEEKTPLWKLVLDQFNDNLVKILLLAAGVSFLLAWIDDGEDGLRAFVEPAVILLILILNAIVGVWQESNAERALDALKEMQSDTAKVYRGGVLTAELAARELVPGDVIELHEGDKVPADSRVVQLRSLTLLIDQALLTGESKEVNKQIGAGDLEDCPINSKHCMLFSGTAVKKGHCLAVVNSIGMHTEIGEIHSSIQKAAEEDSSTPLKKKLDEFGDLLTKVIGVICLLVWVINIKFFLTFQWDPSTGLPTDIAFSFAKCTYYFKIAVALAVAAIPEGLPAVITTCLALGTRKMAKQNAIVRKLPSVETLGCTTVICSDKTGTLTTNQMSVVEIVLPGSAPDDLRTYQVSGSTYSSSLGEVVNAPSNLDAGLLELSRVATLCNECQLERLEANEGKEVFKVVGMPTEGALRVLADKLVAKHTQDPDPFNSAKRFWDTKHSKQCVLEFDRERKRMSVISATRDAPTSTRYATRSSINNPQTNTLQVKGQAQSVISQCSSVLLANGKVVPFTPQHKQVMMSSVNSMASRALRCLALASKASDRLGPLAGYDGPDHPEHQRLLDPASYAQVEQDLTFVGIAALMDPPRPEVKAAIAKCHQAGMRVMVITGDYQATAEAICCEIGVFRQGEELEGKSISGSVFFKMTPAEQRRLLGTHGGRCFSGAQPNHKQAIVERLKEMRQVVAMTGDGVNDAPALKLADIGIAMGIAGTEVAKEASDMVLADDNFSSIVAAVAEGRSIYNNMKAFIRYMISSNIGEVVSIFLTAALGMPEGLIPVQLLWVNLVTDGPPATALGFNRADPDIMQRPPRAADDALISMWVFFRYMVVGLYVGVATVAGFGIWYTHTSFLGIDLGKDGHTPISFHQLTHWHDCPSWEGFTPSPFTAGSQTYSFDSDACEYFDSGKAKASTLSLSILVAIEMFNAVNALSEDSSLLAVPPWTNPYLIIAMFVSFGLHFVILYVPMFATVFGIVPLSIEEWKLVLLLAFPVILIDEVLKLVGRIRNASQQRRLKKET